MKKMISKTASLLLVFSMLFSNGAWAKDNNQLEKQIEQDIKQTQDPLAIVPPVIQSNSVSGAVYESDWSQKLEKINLKALENIGKRLLKQNQFVYSKKDLEELILGGATEEDIYLSDLLGNEWLTSPRGLIDQKRDNRQTWDEIEASLKTEKESKLKELLRSNPKAEQLFEKRTINTAEKIEILEAANSSNGSILEQSIKSYETNGLRDLDERKNTSIATSSGSPSVIQDDEYEQSVMDPVYTSDGLLEQSISSREQLFAMYTQDTNSIYNGLITQMQINQTTKPQYSDGNGTSEMIDPSSGKLVWKETEINLPGRDGLDLNIGVINQSNYAYTYQMTFGISGNLKKANYLLSRYDLGTGWAFQFPSIQVAEGGYLYYHKGDGAVYRIDFNASNNPDNFTHLIGYQGKDMKLVQDTQGLFNNGQSSSSYYLEYANKKREYFAADGRLLGIVDRYNNTITFQHTDRQTYDDQTNKVISSITDSLGRVITFTYDTTLRDSDSSFNGEKIIVSVKDLNGNVSQTVTYMKSRGNCTFNGNPDGYAPFLWYIQKQDYSLTQFNYHNFQNNKFDYNNSVDSSYAGWVSLHPLQSINDTISYTNYQFEKVTRRLGSSGFGEEYRATSRNNQVKKNYIASGDFNHVNYSYTGDYTGYDPANPYYNPSSFVYATTQTIQSTSLTSGMATTTNFNNQGQVTSTSNRASNGERKVINYVAFDPTYTSMPTAIESREYSSDSDSSPNVLYMSKQYSDWGGVQGETAPLTQVQYNDATIKSKYTTSYTYDPTYYFLKTRSGYQNNNILLKEQYDYYSNGRLKSYSNAKGEVTNYCYEALDSNGLTSNCTDPNSNIVGKINKIKTTQSLGDGKTSISETIFDVTTNYAYPSEIRSYFTTKSTTGENVTQVVKKTMAYTMGTGLLESDTNGNGKVTSYLYDALGRPTQIKYPRFTNANGASYDVVDEISYVNSLVPSGADAENASVNSLLVSSKRKYTQVSNNAMTQLSNQNDYYDGLGFLRYSQQSNNGIAQITQYRLDDLTRAVYAIDPMNNTTTVVYDAWGAQKEAKDTFGNLYVSESNLKLHKGIHYFIAATDIPAYRNNQSLNNLKSSYVEQDFDQWGQLLVNRVYKDWPNQTVPLTELYTYDIAGNLITYTDPKKNLNSEGVTTKYTYDALNRLSEVKDALGQITKYPYNASGQITNTTVQSYESDTPKVISTKSYNEVGGLISKSDPSSNTESYLYNDLGLLQQRTDRNGTLFAYQYDEQNRPTLLTATGAGSVTQQNKSIIGSNGILLDTQEAYNNGVKSSSLTTQIDYLKRITLIEVQGANSSYSSILGISYDKNNRIIQYNILGGASTNFTTQFKYDRLRLDKVQTNGQLALDNTDAGNVKYLYYPNGQIKSLSYPPLTDGSILSTEYVYDNLNRISSMTNKKGTTLLSSYNYTYDNNGNIETISQILINQTTKTNSYTYDKLNRLNSITRWDGTTAAYTYNLKGNRQTLSDTRDLPFNFDETSYQYDLFNTLTSTTKGSVSTTFDYSPDGLRYRKTTGSTIKQYRYNANQEVISEVNSSNVATANYVRGDRLLVKKDVTTNKDYYYLYNGHGDVIQMIDTSGKVVNSYEYDEWGNITQQTEEVANEFKYAGEIYDKETGLYYLRARYYDPSMGRFINEDTYEGQINNPLTLNLYTYVFNNPLRFWDPSGHDAIGQNTNLFNINIKISQAKIDYETAKKNNDKAGMKDASKIAEEQRALAKKTLSLEDQKKVLKSTDLPYLSHTFQDERTKEYTTIGLAANGDVIYEQQKGYTYWYQQNTVNGAQYWNAQLGKMVIGAVVSFASGGGYWAGVGSASAAGLVIPGGNDIGTTTTIIWRTDSNGNSKNYVIDTKGNSSIEVKGSWGRSFWDGTWFEGWFDK
ncbi:RHS repeat protein [Cohnella endophytica]|uniref:RHS repeat protein n=1 Tax=Cohnella endophytica TaxID=2419778 RepID=A0A494XU27_9BACL|nr:RHS repeat-associated core domain-containing protein [Cohnella endophytica]RKP54133.1 RHS repeat protein [Cohnella endophytica]